MDLSKYSLFKSMQAIEKPVSRVVSIGSFLPERVIDNKTLAEMIDAPDTLKRKLPSLIKRITGVETRRYSEKGDAPSDLAVEACQKALEKANLNISDIDTLIFSSTDMDTLEPATANIIQAKLGINLVNAFDVSNACNSFLQAMNMANSMIATGAAQRVLITSGEIGSYVVNKEIKNVEELRIKMGGLTLGDAGAAIIMEKATDTSGLTEINLISMGEHWKLCHVPETTDWRGRDDGSIHGWFYLDMPALAQIVRPTTIEYFNQYEEYRKNTYSENHFNDSLTRIIPHQISTVLIEEMIQATKTNPNKVCISANTWGNIASTSIPLTLNRAIEKGDLTLGSGQEALLFGAASGYSLGHIRIKL